MKKLDGLEVKQLSQSHPGSKWGTQNLKTNLFDSSHAGFNNPMISNKHISQEEFPD